MDQWNHENTQILHVKDVHIGKVGYQSHRNICSEAIVKHKDLWFTKWHKMWVVIISINKNVINFINDLLYPYIEWLY